MKTYRWIILLACLGSTTHTPTNVSLHLTLDNEIGQTPGDKTSYHHGNQSLKPANLGSYNSNSQSPHTVYDKVQEQKNKVHQNQSKQLEHVNITKYVFNDTPTPEEEEKLDFIRKTMKAVLGDTQLCNNSITGRGRIEGTSCFQDCSCDVSCHTTGDCCPDIQHKKINITVPVNETKTPKPVCKTMHTLLYAQKIQKSPTPVPESPSIKDEHNISVEILNKLSLTESLDHSLFYPQYLVITSCPSQYTNKSVIEKCLQNDANLIQDMVPVVDLFTNVVYKNKHCAVCNGIKDYISWKITSDCLQLYTNNCPMNTVSDLLEIAESGQCTVLFTPSLFTNVKTHQCQTDSRTDVIHRCNVTGLWREYDERMSALCTEQGTNMHYYKQHDNTIFVYRNVFCYLCNQGNGTLLQHHQCLKNTVLKSSREPWYPFQDFRVEIDEDLSNSPETHLYSCSPSNGTYTEVGSQKDGLSQCKVDETWDVYMKKCRPLTCPLYQEPIHQMCLLKQRSVHGLVLAVQLHITLDKDSFISTQSSAGNQLNSFFAALYKTIDKYLDLSEYKCNTKHIEILAQSENDKIHSFFLKLKVENTLHCSIRDLIELLSKIATGKKVLQDTVYLKSYNIFRLEISIEYHTLVPENFNFKYTILTLPHGHLKELILEPLFNCPKIRLSLGEYHKAVQDNIIEELNPCDFEVQFSTTDKTVEICLVKYLQKWLLSKYTANQEQESSKNNDLEVTLSMTATVTSMISVIIVLITYALFSELRFIPGKLFMVLCTNLLAAQMFFACGNNDGYSDFLCKFIGIGNHFFWLATVFSMNSCLLLMARSVKSPMEQKNRLLMQSKSISKASTFILYTYITPLLIVLVTLLSAWIQHDPHGGYGGHFCYISTSDLRIYAFAIPVGIVIIINFTMFAVILTSLVCVMKTYQKSNNQYFIAFLKLSTITGMFWTFGYLYEATKIVYFGYLFTILNAGQGFFLMWSFIMNKRVLNLYISLTRQYFHVLQEWTQKITSSATGQNSSLQS